jgi:hypothetical protein
VGPAVSEKEERKGYRFGIGELGRGLYLDRAGIVSPRPFLFFSFFSSFSFSVLHFFHNYFI